MQAILLEISQVLAGSKMQTILMMGFLYILSFF